MRTTEPPLYQPLLDVLLDHFGARLRAVVLFGSRARDEGSPESDTDLLVVAEGLPNHPIDRLRALQVLLRPIAGQQAGGIAVVARTPGEITANLSPLLLDICADGVCLYGAAYFEPLRARALAAVQSAGLTRRRVAGTWMWVFPRVRTTNWRLDWDGFHDRV